MKRTIALFSLILLTFASFAQEDDLKFRATFIEANQLMEEYNYSEALKQWMDIAQTEGNPNVYYKIGLCYWKLPKKKQEALPYFQKAVSGVSDRYDPFSPAEESAPIETYFYIANAYHLSYDLDSAIQYYNKFKNEINHNHEFWARTDLEIEMCNNAKSAMLNPVDIQVINLGPLVNTMYPEYAPVISVDESAMYFTSKRLRKDSSNLYSMNDEDGFFFEDIYVSYKGSDGAWNEAEPINFNTSSNEATLSLSADGETMYIYKTGEKGYGDLYYSKLQGNIWTDPQKLGSDINTADGHETHAAVTPDGRRLYFISNRVGSMKFPDKAHEKVESRDIYFCNLLPTGEWALAQPVTELNTAYHEDGVFIHPDGKTMYFSSEGHGSIGGFDIFMSTFQEDSTWSTPENIGYPINTTDDDIFFVTSASGKRSYYSSVREDGFGDKDVYVISMLSFQEKPLTLLIGEIIAANGQTVPDGIQIYVSDNETGEQVGIFKPRARDNKFTIIIPPGSDYHMEYTLDDSTFYKDDIFIPYNSTYQEIQKGINMGAIDFSTGKSGTDASKAIKGASGSENPDVEGTLKYGGAGAIGVVVNLQDSDKNKIATSTTDGSGNFTFVNLAPGSKYFVQIDPEANGDIPDDAQLFLKDSKTGAMLPVSKLGTGMFAFETLAYIEADDLELMDENADSKVLAAGGAGSGSKDSDSKTDKKEEKLPAAYKTEVQEFDGEKYIIHEVQTGETMYAISLMYNLKLPVVLDANPGKNELIYPGDQILLPIPSEVKFYMEFFDYNVTDIRLDASDYTNFLAQVEKVVKENGKATLMIESSSSKVPSAKFDGNKNLSIKRAESAKTLLVKSLNERSITSDKLIFADMSTLVRGPEYNNDAQENKATYKNYQYIKIIVK